MERSVSFFKVSLALQNTVYLMPLLEYSKNWQRSESEFGFYFWGKRIIYYKEFHVEYSVSPLCHLFPKFSLFEYVRWEIWVGRLWIFLLSIAISFMVAGSLDRLTVIRINYWVSHTCLDIKQVITCTLITSSMMKNIDALELLKQAH